MRPMALTIIGGDCLYATNIICGASRVLLMDRLPRETTKAATKSLRRIIGIHFVNRTV